MKLCSIFPVLEDVSFYLASLPVFSSFGLAFSGRDMVLFAFGFGQGYASDTFALALAAVHLFTGEAPYEEIMEEVRYVSYDIVVFSH